MADRKAYLLRALFLLTAVWVGLLASPWCRRSLASLVYSSGVAQVFSNTLAASDAIHRDDLIPDRASINDTGCQMPTVRPFNSEAKKRFHKYPPIDCTGGITSLVYVRNDALRLNKTKVESSGLGKVDYCKYLPLRLRAGTERSLQPLNWSRSFLDSMKLRKEDEHLLVHCYQNDSLISKDYISRVVKKKAVEDRSETNYKIHTTKNAPSETLSVLLVGVDGMSKANFVRTMPKTRQFLLNNLKAIEFHKVNKVGLNTFPNIVGLLSGYHSKELLKFWSIHQYLDKIDHVFLWDEYKMAGYRTAMMLDAVHVTAFHYLKKGWRHPPFDYYNRPLLLKAAHDKEARTAGRFCLGEKPVFAFHLDYWLQLAAAFNNKSNPYFAFSFFATLTHDDHNKATAGDLVYRAFFHRLWADRLLDNTLLVFFSDHGLRFGKYRGTYPGMLEARSPFLFFVFPPWFERKYPGIMAAVRTNQHRLVTHFDVHQTLHQLPFFSPSTGANASNTKASGGPPRGLNLFHEIPENRTCQDAGIPLRFCKCNQRVKAYHLTKAFATSIVEYINGQSSKYRAKCQQLALKTVHSTRELGSDFYQTTLETTPGNGLYEATVYHNGSRTTNVTQVKGVTRTNLYRGQAECVDSLTVRPFCYCKR